MQQIIIIVIFKTKKIQNTYLLCTICSQFNFNKYKQISITLKNIKLFNKIKIIKKQ